MDFSKEWTDLNKISFTIEEIRRISPEARLSYYQKLRRQEDLCFVSWAGHFFMEWFAADIDGKHNPNSWILISRDVKTIIRLIEDGRYYDKRDWELTYKELYDQKEFLFNTGLGYEFLRNLYLALNPDKKKNLNTNKNIPKHALTFPKRLGRFLIIFFFAISVGTLSIWLYLTIDAYRNQKQLEAIHSSDNETELLNEAVTKQPEKEIEGDQKTAKDNSPVVLSEYKDALSLNSQLFGWLKADGLSADLPVVRPDNGDDFYLTHDFSGDSNDHGCLFVDSGCKLNPRSNYIVVYGHNMKDGTMFGNIDYYTDPSYLSQHKDIYFDTIYKKGRYEAIATLRTRLLNQDEEGFRYYRLNSYKNENEWKEFMAFAEENLAAGSLSSLKYKDKLLLLSTCEYSQDNGRLVVVCRLKN
ncbi:MAG: class B sortase [Lachnospiraceae bacterium]|nr:class B sortase [Lachnospiraceae bacterium]